jgi:hypothetical protein
MERLHFESPRFLNIDLDIRSRRSLPPLAAAWPWSYLRPAAENQPDPHWLILRPRRITPRRHTATAETVAKELLEQIRGLRAEARRCWRHARFRVFDIGVQAGGPGSVFEDVRLTGETLRQIALVGANVKVTVYPALPQSSQRPADSTQFRSARGCQGRLSTARESKPRRNR